jgi:protein phosphatase 2C family protein 2/3
MEDVDFLFESVKITDKRSVSVFGVLDGHGGKECALYCAEDIPIKVSALLRSGLSCPETLFKTFLEVDKEFLEANVGDNSGSTANVAIYDKLSNSLFVANTADTRAILSRNATAYDLSMDRKATDPEEIARISKAGGFVISGRVLGTLAVSRALGDAQLKSKKGVLIPDPEVSCFNPSKQDEFMVIATDGLWDVFSSQGVVDFVRDLLQQENLLGETCVRT